jgi:hypothetical protein
MTALEVLYAVSRAGGRLIPNGNKITMEALTPLPATLVAQVRQHKPALLAILHPRPPRLAGGIPITDAAHPCLLCGGVEWQQHVTYRYCLACGREDGPGAVQEGLAPMSTPRAVSTTMSPPLGGSAAGPLWRPGPPPQP